MTPADDFPWRSRMLMYEHGALLDPPRRIVVGVRMWMDLPVLVWAEDGATDCDCMEHGEGLAGLYVPDLTDPATLGALAGAVREAWGDPYAHAVPLVEGSLVGPPRWRWRVLCAIPGPEPIRVRLWDFIDDDLGAAWLAAWAARPRSTI